MPIEIRIEYLTSTNHKQGSSAKKKYSWVTRELFFVLALSSEFKVLNGNQFSIKFLHQEDDMSDMQLRYHQLCSLASNIPSELRVAPRSTPARTSHFF